MSDTDRTGAISLGRMMSLIARRWRQSLDSQLQPLDLTDATWQPLLELQRHGRPLHPKEIADALLLDKSSMVRILRTLEAKGLVTRTPDARDGRALLIAITPEGESRLDRIITLSRQIEAHVTRVVSEEDLDRTRHVLATILGAMDTLPGPGSRIEGKS